MYVEFDIFGQMLHYESCVLSCVEIIISIYISDAFELDATQETDCTCIPMFTWLGHLLNSKFQQDSGYKLDSFPVEFMYIIC